MLDMHAEHFKLRRVKLTLVLLFSFNKYVKNLLVCLRSFN